MSDTLYRPKTLRMWALMIPAGLYLGWMAYLPAMTGITLIDGSIGVVLGLYISSHPAANGIDLFFLQRGGFKRIVSGWAGLGWLILNAVVMFIGFIVIVFGSSRFTSPNAW